MAVPDGDFQAGRGRGERKMPNWRGLVHNSTDTTSDFAETSGQDLTAIKLCCTFHHNVTVQGCGVPICFSDAVCVEARGFLGSR
jgi:hypothetical protein